MVSPPRAADRALLADLLRVCEHLVVCLNKTANRAFMREFVLNVLRMSTHVTALRADAVLPAVCLSCSANGAAVRAVAVVGPAMRLRHSAAGTDVVASVVGPAVRLSIPANGTAVRTVSVVAPAVRHGCSAAGAFLTALSGRVVLETMSPARSAGGAAVRAVAVVAPAVRLRCSANGTLMLEITPGIAPIMWLRHVAAGAVMVSVPTVLPVVRSRLPANGAAVCAVAVVGPAVRGD